MTTRRQFVQSLPAFAVAAHMTLDSESAPAAPNPAAPAAGHFHPKGKAPSEFTKELLRKAKQALPFEDTRDFDEQRRGLIARMPQMQIKNDAGGIAWDMTRFQFLDQKDEFDTVHPSMHRIGQLNNNYGLYEVVPGIYPGPRH
jgi:alkyl sulfatase BDS1-like metallo-beta-lactamase superfamily hydrolase